MYALIRRGPRRSSVANHAAGGIFSPQLIAEVKQRFNEFCSWVLALTLEVQSIVILVVLLCSFV
jgi:hypothetical protein